MKTWHVCFPVDVFEFRDKHGRKPVHELSAIVTVHADSAEKARDAFVKAIETSLVTSKVVAAVTPKTDPDPPSMDDDCG